MATDDSDTKPLGFSIDIGEILKEVTRTRKRPADASPSNDHDPRLRDGHGRARSAARIRAELADVERALKLLAEEIVRLRRANEDLADKVAKLTKR